MRSSAISTKEITASLVVWLTVCFILSGLERRTTLILSSFIMPSFLFILGLAWGPAALNVPRFGMHKEPALC